MGKHLLVILCTSAGSQDQVSNDIKDLLDSYETVYRFVVIKTPPAMAAAVSKLRLSTYDGVVVYGGDGTVVAAIKIFRDYKLPLIVLPGGTANVLVNHFGMPPDPLDGLKLYLENTYIVNLIDIARIGSKPLVLDMHMGLWTEAITGTPRSLKKKIGPAAYGWTTLKKVRTATKHDYVFAIDGRPAEKVQGYTFLVVNQGKYRILGLPLFPHEQAPGMVQLAIVKRVRPYLLMAWFFYKLLTGRNLTSVIAVYRARSIRILKSPSIVLADDAEGRLRPPLVVKGSEDSVRIVVPPKKSDVGFPRLWLRRFGLWRVRMHQRLRVFSGQDPDLRYTHVAPGIYLGGKVTPRAFKLFREWGITGVVSMRTTKPPQTPDDIETLWLPTKDWTPPEIADFAKGVSFIKHHLANNGAVYIHCQLGEGRGPSMAAAYLISKGFSAEEAVAQLVKYRPVVQPNAQQLKRLARWQEVYNKYLS